MQKHKIVSNSVVYLLFSFLAQAINFFLLPLYTKNFSVAEFGRLTIINAIQILIGFFVTLNIHVGLSRFYNEYQAKNDLKNTALSFAFLSSGFWIGLVVLVGPAVSGVLFGSDHRGFDYLLYAVLNACLLGIHQIYANYFAMQFQALQVSLLGVARSLLVIIVSYWLIVVEGKGIIGALQAQLGVCLVLALVLLGRDLPNYKFTLRKDFLTAMVKFTTGLLPSETSAWILTLVDRYFLEHLVSLKEVGLYSLPYRIGTLTDQLFVSPFNNTFTPIKFTLYKEAQGKRQLAKIFNLYNFFGWFFILGLSLFSGIAIQILATPEYYQGFYLVPFVAISYFLWGLASFYDLGLHLANKTLTISLVVIISALANVILNFLLIPSFQAWGAAIATLISYQIACLLYYFLNKKYYDLNVGFQKPLQYGFLFVILYVSYLVVKPTLGGIFSEVLFNLLLCLIYLVLCWQLKIIALADIQEIIISFKKSKKNGANHGE